MKNYDAFIYYTNSITEYLINKYELKPNATFGEALIQSRYLNSIINRYFDLLDLYLKLRNVLVHKTTIKGVLADPSDEVLKNIETIYKELVSPTKVSGYIKQNVISFDIKTPISTVLKIIHDFSYTFFPIFDGSQLLGLLTSDGISKGMSQYFKDDIISLNDIRVRELIEIDDNRKNFATIKPSSNIYDVIEIFEKGSLKTGQPLTILIADGTINQQNDIKGIITYWDIEKLREKIILKW